ncbi:hypothetical protein LOCC1_G008853 [Lachnellula occidentalis]|uniref:EGF-like domain-containing protein n=1 Tax=Lachnellula occidentalis TaxID=215460 RepID=A0A8H8RHZ0_9HELO|nr:hypothetical protein LOCC1_G008853 [Lachnellula occidentalis]
MSDQQWQPPSTTLGRGGGSVKRARQRMEAGLPPERPPPPPQQQRPFAPSRPAPEPSMTRSRPQMPPGLTTSKGGQGPIGVAISRPTQVPQWPLAGTIEGPDARGNRQYQPPPGRSIPPQRPPRPSHVPSILDASRLHEHTPSFQYQPQNSLPERSQGRGLRVDEEDDSPILTSPMTQSSRPSTVSSVGTIPDFPVPMLPEPLAPPKRSGLGPPPSSRRGASSYYSQASFVSPIPEESRGSYASSAAIPSSWGSNSPGYPYDDDVDDDEDDITERGFEHDVIEERGESRESNFDDNEDRGLIRSASLGKRAKPSMITTKSFDKTERRPSLDSQQSQQPQPPTMERMGVIDNGVGGALAPIQRQGSQRDTRWPIIGNPDSPLASGTGFIEGSSSEESVPTVASVTADRAMGTESPAERRANQMLGAYNAASSLQPSVPNPIRTPSPGFSKLSAIRRPPRLDIDAVRDAEARGSLTSLPDLIRRATRLAAMMDRGKRPGSRLHDLNDFPMTGDAKDRDLDSFGNEKRRSGLSGMLAAFPPPGVATPRDGTPRPMSAWPSPYPESDGNLDANGQAREKKRSRCCGLPCWGFLLVVLTLLIIIAAAVVIPLEFLVIHKPKAASAALTPVQKCEANSTTACQNGGSSWDENGSCACLCTNGFTGSTCSIAGSVGCVTTTLSGSDLRDVTIGDSLSRLISGAQTNFSIPLSANTILARFNSASLSCSSENALVTFDGQSQRVNQANDAVTPTSTSASATSSSQHKARDNHKHRRRSSPPSPSTSNGIIYDSSSTPTSASGSATSETPSASPTATFSVTEEVMDFARVVVLYVLQQEQLENAESAQTALQKFFSQPDTFTTNAAANVSLGSGNTVNLLAFTVNVGNGTLGTKNVERRNDVGRRSANLWSS